MLDIPSLAVILAALSSACLLWWFILFGRPLVARQKLEIETRKVRDRLVDAQMRGAIESNNPHLPLLLNYCGLVTDHADRLSLCRVVIVRRTMDRARFTPPTLKRAPRGILRNTELELDSLVWKYMIDGSRLWWLFYPTRPLYRRLPPLAEAAKSVLHLPDEPADIASGLRRGLEGNDDVSRLILEDESPLNQRVHGKSDMPVPAGV